MMEYTIHSRTAGRTYTLDQAPPEILFEALAALDANQINVDFDSADEREAWRARLIREIEARTAGRA